MFPQFSNKIFTLSVISTVLLLTTPSLAATTDTSDSWISANYNLTHIGEDFVRNRAELVKKSELLFTTNTNEAGLLFSCVNKRFRVIVSTKPQDWAETLTKTTRHYKARHVSIALNDGPSVAFGKFIYKSKLNILSGKTSAQAVKLYNATIQGQQITLKMSGKSAIKLTPPKPNQMFADFGSQCGIGKHK